jgi:hypothetical protein
MVFSSAAMVTGVVTVTSKTGFGIEGQDKNKGIKG